MNELDLVAGLRAEAPPMSDEARQRGRAALAAQASPVAAPPHRRGWWRVAVPAGATLAVVAAVATAVIIGTPSGEPDPTAQRARDLLLLAAGAVEGQEPIDPEPDQFIYYELVQYPSYGVADVPGEYVNEILIWESVDASHPGEVRITGFDSCDTADAPEPCTLVHELLVHGVPDLGHAPYTVLSDLPTDPTELMERIDADASGDRIRAWHITGRLAERLPPPQRAALFRGLATMPDIQLVEDVIDAAGRPGVGVGIFNPKLGGLDMIIFDPATHAYLGTAVIIDDGSVNHDRALVRTGVVDEVGQVPD